MTWLQMKLLVMVAWRQLAVRPLRLRRLSRLLQLQWAKRARRSSQRTRLQRVPSRWVKMRWVSQRSRFQVLMQRGHLPLCLGQSQNQATR